MNAPWWRVTVRCHAKDADAIAVILVSATGQGIEEPDAGELRAMAETESGAVSVLAEVKRAFPDAVGEITRLEPVDWSVHWRDGIATHRFGRLVVSPSWLPVELGAAEVLVTLDPESAFGSGEHGSTRVAMILLERHLRPGQQVLDFGSGSGILAIAAAKLGALSAIGIETDEESLPIAEANAVRNTVESQVAFLLGDAGELGPLAGPADVICSNILRSVNTLLLGAVRASLTSGGLAIFSGMEAPEAELFRPVLADHDWDIIDEALDTGWWGVVARVR